MPPVSRIILSAALLAPALQADVSRTLLPAAQTPAPEEWASMAYLLTTPNPNRLSLSGANVITREGQGPVKPQLGRGRHGASAHPPRHDPGPGSGNPASILSSRGRGSRGSPCSRS